MFKCQEDQLSILGLCVEEPMLIGRVAGLNYHAVNSGRRAIDMLRMLSFDLVLVGMRVPDVSAWDLVRRMRTAWPWQKWSLVAARLTEQQEITARMFGAIKIYEETPSSDELFELTARLRDRAQTAVLHSQFTQPTLPSRALVSQ